MSIESNVFFFLDFFLWGSFFYNYLRCDCEFVFVCRNLVICFVCGVFFCFVSECCMKENMEECLCYVEFGNDFL